MSDHLTEATDKPVVVPATESRFSRVVGPLRHLLARLIWGLVTTGLLLRFTVQDQYHPLAIAYYLTPIPTLPLWCFVAGCLWGRPRNDQPSRNRISRMRLSLIASLVFVCWTLQTEYVVRATPPRDDESRFVFWNSARVEMGVDRLADRLKGWEPHVIGLVEANGFYKKTVEKWRNAMPDYEIAPTHFGGLVAIKGTIRRQINHNLSPSSWCDQFDVTVGTDDFTLLLVDISANINLSRRQPLLDLANLTKRLDDRPVIIMGDFNTPDDSVLLNPLREICQQAFRQKGYGYAATWPMPLPVLTLDQVWTNRHVEVSRCEHHWSIYSDHRPVTSRISFPKETPAAAPAK